MSGDKAKPAIRAGDLEPVAGGGLLDRRLFLKRGAALGALTALAASGLGARAEDVATDDPTGLITGRPPWMRVPGKPFSNYGQPSKYESEVIRWISANSAVPGNGVSWTPLHALRGTVVPNGLHFERHHNGVPQIDPKYHRLMIHGLVKRPLIYTVDELLRYPMVSRLCFIECGGNSYSGWHKHPIQTPAGYFNGLVSCSEWTGVPLSTLLDEAGIEAKGHWLLAEGADVSAVQVSIPVEKAMDDAFVALYQNGERIRPENGYPMRLVLPGWEGILHIKWVRRLKAVGEPVMTRDETAKYTELLPDGKARQFTFVMAAKSLITSPSAGMTLPEKGFYEITGLAWSGHGRIRRVEVSADGGKSWAEAALQEPVLPTCFTRFRIPWRWNGASTILQSRAVDETGYVQPTREKLIAERGRNGYFHYNAIVSWKVDEDGTVHHVYA